MKIEFDKKKTADTISDALQKTADFGKKTAVSVKTTTATMLENAKVASHARQLKKYNPLFPEQFRNTDYHLPNVIIIVDDAVRREIKVCKGAIGWTGKVKDVEILYLYDEAVAESGINFIPSATCDSVYYTDDVSRSRYIRTDKFFEKIHEEKIAELEHIAYSLGAKCCRIALVASLANKEEQSSEMEASAKANGVSNSESRSQYLSENSHHQQAGELITKFQGTRTPKRPELKWFAHDDTLNRLIDMCCAGECLESRDLTLSSSSSFSMSKKVAVAIDTAVENGGTINGSGSMSKQIDREQHSKFHFYIEF